MFFFPVNSVNIFYYMHFNDYTTTMTNTYDTTYIHILTYYSLH